VLAVFAFIRQGLALLRSRPQPQDFDAPSKAGIGEKTAPSQRDVGRQEKAKYKRKGPLWHLPKDICPICYSRLRHDVDPKLGLPLPPPTTDAMEAVEIAQHQNEPDEARIHLPTRASCDIGCVYCYYCIAGELAAKAAAVQEAEKYHKKTGDREAGSLAWQCLRCGDAVWSCRRVSQPKEAAEVAPFMESAP
jgi:peroxin-2